MAEDMNLNPPDYEVDYPTGMYGNNIEKIYEMPDIDDMAGVFLRGRFKNERELNAAIRLMYRHDKFNDKKHQELLRARIAGSAALQGLRSLEALFAGTNLLAPDMYRSLLGLKKKKRDEDDRIIKGGSDFRREERPHDTMGNT